MRQPHREHLSVFAEQLLERFARGHAHASEHAM
jgi:hypothetical protein